MKKLLIITYYWPPSGGAGVQRWLKLSRYIQEEGTQVFVIAPSSEDASYLTIDESLEAEIHPNIKVIRTPSFEPLNIYKKLVGKKNVPTAGMANVDTRNKLQQLSLFIRSNLFIPDPRKYWKNYALKAAKKLIHDEGIEHLVTSSPPHSVQLIGLQLKKELNIHWIADLRDLWTGIYYYDLLNHSDWSARKDASIEKRVLRNADLVCTVSPIFRDEFIQLSGIDRSKTMVVPNGYDPMDFEHFTEERTETFYITYTGTISIQYTVEPLLQALTLIDNKRIKLRFIGYTDPALVERISELGLVDRVEIISYVTHAESVAFLQNSAALLLVGPLNQNKNEGSVPAKVFEYLASKRPIIYIGKKDGYVASILQECEAGNSFDAQVEPSDLKQYILGLYDAYMNGDTFSVNLNKVEQFSRKVQARDFIAQIEKL